MYSNDVEHGQSVAENLQNTLNLPELSAEVREGDNRIFTFKEEAGTNYQMTYLVRDGTWSLADLNYLQKEGSYDNSEELEEDATEILANLNLLPKQAELSISENGTFHWTIQPSTYSSTDIEDGLIMMDLEKDDHVGSLFYTNTENKFVRDVEILSTKQAYEKIEKGNFDQYIPFQQGDQLVVTGCDLNYMYDSKGYYQPIYLFTGTLNGEEWSLQVTAIPPIFN